MEIVLTKTENGKTETAVIGRNFKPHMICVLPMFLELNTNSWGSRQAICDYLVLGYFKGLYSSRSVEFYSKLRQNEFHSTKETRKCCAFQSSVDGSFQSAWSIKKIPNKRCKVLSLYKQDIHQLLQVEQLCELEELYLTYFFLYKKDDPLEAEVTLPNSLKRLFIDNCGFPGVRFVNLTSLTHLVVRHVYKFGISKLQIKLDYDRLYNLTHFEYSYGEGEPFNVSCLSNMPKLECLNLKKSRIEGDFIFDVSKRETKRPLSINVENTMKQHWLRKNEYYLTRLKDIECFSDVTRKLTISAIGNEEDEKNILRTKFLKLKKLRVATVHPHTLQNIRVNALRFIIGHNGVDGIVSTGSAAISLKHFVEDNLIIERICFSHAVALGFDYKPYLERNVRLHNQVRSACLYTLLGCRYGRPTFKRMGKDVGTLIAQHIFQHMDDAELSFVLSLNNIEEEIGKRKINNG
jgi:hypothetical protein